MMLPVTSTIIKTAQKSCYLAQTVPKQSICTVVLASKKNSSCCLLSRQLDQLSLTTDVAIQSRSINYLSYAKIRRPIQGWPRPLKYNRVRPEPNKYGWYPHFPSDGRYTTKPLHVRKLAGRHPETGRVVVRTLGGGNTRNYRWIDYRRQAPEGQTVEEKVYHIRYDSCHTTLLALVANGGHRRWIIASENMKPGDIIRTCNIIPKNPIRVQEGDAWPVGAMAMGTLVHNLETQFGLGLHVNPDSYEYKWDHFGPDAKRLFRYAGDYGTIGRRIGKTIVIKAKRDGREIAVDERCMATVGKCSNPDHHLVNRLVAQRSRWLGHRPRSGLWHRKDGYCGRKVHLPKPLKTIYSDQRSQPEEPTILQPLHTL